MRILLAVLVTLASSSIHAGGLFKWTDPATGVTVYSSAPPPATVKSVEEKRVVPSTIETSRLPYAVQDTARRSPIVLYVSDCGEYCNAARAYLNERGLPYAERNPQQPEHAEQLKKVSGGTLEVPFLLVGSKSIRGFDEAQYAAALDAAGYPKASLKALRAKGQPATTPTSTKDVAQAHGAEPAKPEASAERDPATLR